MISNARGPKAFVKRFFAMSSDALVLFLRFGHGAVTGDEWFETAWDGLGAAGRTGFGNSGLIGLASATCLPRRRYRVELKSKDASSLGFMQRHLIPADTGIPSRRELARDGQA